MHRFSIDGLPDHILTTQAAPAAWNGFPAPRATLTELTTFVSSLPAEYLAAFLEDEHTPDAFGIYLLDGYTWEVAA